MPRSAEQLKDRDWHEVQRVSDLIYKAAIRDGRHSTAPHLQVASGGRPWQRNLAGKDFCRECSPKEKP